MRTRTIRLAAVIAMVGTGCTHRARAVPLVAGDLLHTDSSPKAEALIGAWVPLGKEGDTVVRDGPVWHPPASVDGPGAGLELFTRRHYSHQLINTKRSRTDLSSDPTASELIATWGVFGSHGGTYEVHMDTLVIHPFVAKNPRTMTVGSTTKYPFRIKGDTLWIGTMKYVRAE